MRKQGFTTFEVCCMITFIALLVGFVAIIIPEAKEKQQQNSLVEDDSDIARKVDEALKQVEMEDGHAYVPVNRSGAAPVSRKFLRKLMAGFQKAHPEFECYDIDIVGQQSGHATNAYVYGVWFHSSVKTESAEFGK